jgi:hypothetical protein
LIWRRLREFLAGFITAIDMMYALEHGAKTGGVTSEPRLNSIQPSSKKA